MITILTNPRLGGVGQMIEDTVYAWIRHSDKEFRSLLNRWTFVPRSENRGRRATDTRGPPEDFVLLVWTSAHDWGNFPNPREPRPTGRQNSLWEMVVAVPTFSRSATVLFSGILFFFWVSWYICVVKVEKRQNYSSVEELDVQRWKCSGSCRNLRIDPQELTVLSFHFICEDPTFYFIFFKSSRGADIYWLKTGAISFVVQSFRTKANVSALCQLWHFRL